MAEVLEYDCDGCGACCTSMGIPVTEDDCRRSSRVALAVTQMPYLRQHGWVGALGQPEPKGTGCPLLTESGSCQVYEERPACCREMAAGSPLCQWSRGRAGLRPLQPSSKSIAMTGQDKKQLPHVFIALPSRPGEAISLDLAVALDKRTQGEGFNLYDWRAQPSSLLTTNFNMLWVLARNLRTAWFMGRAARNVGTKRGDHPFPDEAYHDGWTSGWDEADGKPGNGPVSDFVMVHSDIAPVGLNGRRMRWIQDLLEERDRTGADVVSAVMPLKDGSRWTSTAAMSWSSRQMRKLTLDECLPPAVPETFGIEELREGNADVRNAGADVLLVNTGLWLASICEPWARRFCFRIYDTIVLGDDGLDKAMAVGEDFLWSMDLHRMGLKAVATTKVAAHHAGCFKWPNYVAHGRGERDRWGEPWHVEPPVHWQYLDRQEAGTTCPPDGGHRAGLLRVGGAA